MLYLLPSAQLSPSIWYFLFHPIFPLLLFSLDPSSIRSSLCLSISFSKTNLIYFRLSHHLLHFSLTFFLFQLLFSIPTFPHSLSQSVSLLYPLSLFQLQSHLWKRSKWGSWQNLFQSEAVPSCSVQYACLVTRSLHLYLILPSASTTHLNNWIIIEAQYVSNERVALLMALTLLRRIPQDYGFPFSASCQVNVNCCSKPTLFL